MRQRVDIGGVRKPKNHVQTVCPLCKSKNASEVRSKRSCGILVRDEYQLKEEKRWTHRAVICLNGCGVILNAEDRQAEFDFDAPTR